LLIAVLLSADTWVHTALAFGPIGRCVAALLLMLPVGIALGLPFPMGIRTLLDSPFQRACGWLANGCTSVLASIASTQLAISVGIPAILIGAIGAYALAAFSGRRLLTSGCPARTETQGH
jgi:hypothetical protein